MKKLLCLSLLPFASTLVNAGTMGPIAAPVMGAFVQAEGGYTWNQIDGLSVFSPGLLDISSDIDKNGGTGRVAVGLLKPINDAFQLSGEMGYGYYGSNTTNLVGAGPLFDAGFGPNLAGLSFKSSQDGFDALAGLIYNQPSFDVFVKAGALMLNSRMRTNVNVGLLIPNSFPINVNIKTIHTEVMPEIKLGGAYHFNDNWALTAAWVHAFGADTGINVTFTPQPLAVNANINFQNPTLDVALLGLEYKFA